MSPAEVSTVVSEPHLLCLQSLFVCRSKHIVHGCLMMEFVFGTQVGREKVRDDDIRMTARACVTFDDTSSHNSTST
jgi:hypothetical protein